MLRYLPYGRYDKGVSAVAVEVGRCVCPNNTAYAVKIKLEQKDLSLPLFIEGVRLCREGVVCGALSFLIKIIFKK